MRRVWLLAWLAMVACSDRTAESGVRGLAAGSSPAAPSQANGLGKESIPAEWTIAEDTSRTGEVTTASLQLPNAKGIEGLLDDEAPRLVLRCLDGRVEASIDMELSDTLESAADSNEAQARTVRIQLDSAPPCE